MKRWASLLLAALLAVGGNEQTFQASGIQQIPVLGQGSYTHPQFFVKEFFVPLVDGVSPIRISIRITTRKVLGALNFTSELGVVGLANISDHITVMVDLKESTRRIMVFPVSRRRQSMWSI